MFQCIGGALEKETPEGAVDKVKETEDTKGPVWRR